MPSSERVNNAVTYRLTNSSDDFAADPDGLERAISQLSAAAVLSEQEPTRQDVLGFCQKHPDALHLLAIIALHGGQEKQAVELLVRAVEIDPEHAAFHSDLGNALQACGELDHALRAFATAVRLDPGAAHLHFNLGNALSKQEKLDEAIAAYEQALALQPDFPEAVFNLDWVTGLKEVDEKEYDDAGGTGGNLKADRTVMDETGAKAQTEISDREFKADSGMTDEQLQSMWMQRVQTTPADFLQFKFSYQLGQQEQAASE